MNQHPRAKAPFGTVVKLRVAFGDVPPLPCILLTPSGRRYDVINIRGKTLHCLVMKADADIEEGTPIIQWTWTARNKRVEP